MTTPPRTPPGTTRKADRNAAVHRPSASSGPSTSSITSSLTHVLSDNTEFEDERPNTPPPYSAPTTSSMVVAATGPPQQPTYPGLPRLDYRLYSPKTFTLSPDLTTLASYDIKYSTYPLALVSLVQSLATVPPKPQIRILGKNGDTVDFDVRVNVLNLFVAEDHGKTGRGTSTKMNYVKVIGPGELGWRGEGKETTGPTRTGLDSWARAFCEDPATNKTFALTRQVTNWDTAYLEMRLLALINSTSYSGKVNITFPLTHSKVVVHSPDKVNRFFSSISKIFTGTKKYEIVESIWPYADVARGVPGRHIMVQEEEEWFNGWKDAIRHAVVMKRKGWCTTEDRLEFLMEPREGEASQWDPATTPT